MAHDDWKNEGDGWHYNNRSDGSLLVYHDSWGGNMNYNHVHVSASDAQRAFASYKPLREWFKENVRR